MAMLLLIVLSTGFLASLLPFVFPGALMSVLGVAVNHWLGGILNRTLGVEPGPVVAFLAGEPTLTLTGVLVVYLPPILILLFVVRGR